MSAIFMLQSHTNGPSTIIDKFKGHQLKIRLQLLNSSY